MKKMQRSRNIDKRYKNNYQFICKAKLTFSKKILMLLKLKFKKCKLENKIILKIIAKKLK